MNVGEVENPNAFNSDEKKTKSTTVGKAKKSEELDSLKDLDAPIGDDGINYDVYADDVNTVSEKPTTETEIKFSANDIQKRQKTEFFVNVKDADKVKRAEEKRNAAEEKRILAETRRAEKEAERTEKAEAAKRARRQKYDEEKEQNTIKELRAEAKHQRKIAAAERRKERCAAIRHAINHFFWHGWHKFVTIAFLIGLAVLGYFTYRSYVYYYANIYPKEQIINDAKEKVEKRTVNTSEFIRQVSAEYNGGKENGFEKACKKAEELIEEAKNNGEDDKILTFTLTYASFIIGHMPMASDKALELVNSVSDLATDDIAKADLYRTYIIVYDAKNAKSMVAYYQELINKLNIKEDGEYEEITYED